MRRRPNGGGSGGRNGEVMGSSFVVTCSSITNGPQQALDGLDNLVASSLGSRTIWTLIRWRGACCSFERFTTVQGPFKTRSNGQWLFSGFNVKSQNEGLPITNDFLGQVEKFTGSLAHRDICSLLVGRRITLHARIRSRMALALA